jgi:hypothetical protein
MERLQLKIVGNLFVSFKNHTLIPMAEVLAPVVRVVFSHFFPGTS